MPDKNSLLTKSLLLAITIPTTYAVILRVIFGVDSWDDLFSVMSVTFLFLLPSIMGFLTVYLLPLPYAQKVASAVIVPWIPVYLFLLITILTQMEGWACWLMALPLFMILASIGGLIGRSVKKRKAQNNLNLSILVLLPLFLNPLENLVEKIPATYEVYTFIDIDAPADKIWNNVVRVREIPQKEDTGHLNRLLGFPRPVKAELNFEGVGAYREAIFTNGLVFHETVTAYQDQQYMVFTIKANPHEIPSTTLDEHILIGGAYFDVLNGTYRLEKLEKNKHRLHLHSHFQLHTTFNFYAGWWAKWIMADIQNNILRVEKQRSERK